MSKHLTHAEADKQIEMAMGAPTSEAMTSFRQFMSGQAGSKLPQIGANIPRLPKETIKKMPTATQ